MFKTKNYYFLFTELSGVCVEPRHCEFINHDGEVTLVPIGDALCTVNGTQINEPTQLTQGRLNQQKHCRQIKIEQQ